LEILLLQGSGIAMMLPAEEEIICVTSLLLRQQ